MNPTIYRTLSAADTNAVLIAAGQKKLAGYDIHNNAASARFVKLYNKVTAPVVGTDVPVLVIGVPANSAARLIFEDDGINFSAGLGIGIVTGITDASTVAPTANDVVVNILYY